jgi:cobalt-zinc-cadmium efflux system outer membrane protein
LDRQLEDRIGSGTCGRSRDALPSDVRLEDGVDEAEVVSVALCRNPALRAELTRIDAALATLDEARRPANPQLSMMGPLGPITAVATLLVPLESLWQMPNRTEAAARDADVAGEAVLMRALDLVRDARLLHVELGLAADRAEVRAELARIAAEIARIASVRAGVGEVSPLEERVLAADARTSADASDLAHTEALMARARLVATLAVDDTPGSPLRARFSTDVATPPDLRELIGFARVARPDARSAELAIAAATARAGWERSRIVNLGALVETQWGQPAGPALRLGGRADLPIFNQNQGGIGRAEAEVERATAQHEMVARTVIMEVTLAHARFEQATRSRQRFETEVLPASTLLWRWPRTGSRRGTSRS